MSYPVRFVNPTVRFQPGLVEFIKNPKYDDSCDVGCGTKAVSLRLDAITSVNLRSNYIDVGVVIVAPGGAEAICDFVDGDYRPHEPPARELYADIMSRVAEALR